MTITVEPAAMPGQYTCTTDAGPVVITEVTSRPEDEFGNYTDGGDASKLLHDIEVETSFTGQPVRYLYGNESIDAAAERVERLVGKWHAEQQGEPHAAPDVPAATPKRRTHMVRTFNGPSVMVEVPYWRPPRGTCNSCDKDVALRKGPVGFSSWFTRRHNNPETGRPCNPRYPVDPSTVYFP